jgi:hypothetical protein
MARTKTKVTITKKAAPLPEEEIEEELPPDDGGYHESPEYQESMDRAKANLKLINFAYDTPRDKMPELTIIPRRMVVRLAFEVCKDAAMNPKRDPTIQSIRSIFRYSLYQLLRSVGGFHLARAGIIAQSQLHVEEEDDSEIHNG